MKQPTDEQILAAATAWHEGELAKLSPPPEPFIDRRPSGAFVAVWHRSLKWVNYEDVIQRESVLHPFKETVSAEESA